MRNVFPLSIKAWPHAGLALFPADTLFLYLLVEGTPHSPNSQLWGHWKLPFTIDEHAEWRVSMRFSRDSLKWTADEETNMSQSPLVISTSINTYTTRPNITMHNPPDILLTPTKGRCPVFRTPHATRDTCYSGIARGFQSKNRVTRSMWT